MTARAARAHTFTPYQSFINLVPIFLCSDAAFRFRERSWILQTQAQCFSTAEKQSILVVGLEPQRFDARGGIKNAAYRRSDRSIGKLSATVGCLALHGEHLGNMHAQRCSMLTAPCARRPAFACARSFRSRAAGCPLPVQFRVGA